jgi:hypothetical protein
MVAFVDAHGKPEAFAFRYLRPDLTIGGKGSNDPKWLRGAAGDLYLDPEHDPRSCLDCPVWRPRALATKGQS